jgi:hypothetical protein
MSEHLSRFGGALDRTRTATGMTLRRRDSLAVMLVTTVVYLVVYLYALGHLSPGLGGFEVFVVSDALSKFFRPALGPLSFTPVARIRLGPVTYLFSLNSVIGLGVLLPVGLNLSLTPTSSPPRPRRISFAAFFLK